MKILVGRKAWLEENKTRIAIRLWVTYVILWPHHFLQPAGNISLWASAHSAVSSWCQTQPFLQHLSQALPLSHCHRDSVCLWEDTAEMCSLERGDGWRRQTTSRPVGLRCCGEDCVARSCSVSVQKGNRLQKSSAGETNSWGTAQRLKELIPNALGYLNRGLTLFLLKTMHSIISYSQ